MSNSTLSIHCQDVLPHTLALAVKEYSNFCIFEIQLQAQINGDVQNVIVFLPSSMFESLIRAATVFNAALDNYNKEQAAFAELAKEGALDDPQA